MDSFSHYSIQWIEYIKAWLIIEEIKSGNKCPQRLQFDKFARNLFYFHPEFKQPIQKLP